MQRKRHIECVNTISKSLIKVTRVTVQLAIYYVITSTKREKTIHLFMFNGKQF